MNYEEKYKQALLRAKEFMTNKGVAPNADAFKTAKELTETIFPELKESEDERIRKEIIQSIQDNMCVIHKDKCIAWLEKQGEQKPVEWDYPYGENETVDKLIAIAECLEMDGDCEFNGYTGTECGKFLRDLARKQVECKPVDKVEPKQEWSEDDEEKFRDVIRLVEQGAPVQSIRDHYTNWLKSFKDRVQPQSHQEWSEEDKSMYIRTLGILGKCYMGELPTKVEEELEWLKSIEPQTHWKPSEQNIKDLEWCADLVKDKMGVGFHRLQVFIDEIKKL